MRSTARWAPRPPCRAIRSRSTPVLGPPVVARRSTVSPFRPCGADLGRSGGGDRLGRAPGARLAWIETPSVDRGVYRLRLQALGDPSRHFPHSFVWVAPARGGSGRDGRQASRRSRHSAELDPPLYDASAGGRPARLLAVVVGLAPAVLFGLGVMRWRTRRRLPRLEVSGRR